MKIKIFYPFFTQVGNASRRISWTIILTLGILNTLTAQNDTLTLTESIELAVQNSPLLRQYEYFRAIETFEKNNLSVNNLPQFSLAGQASYQSEVVTLPFSPPGGENIELPNERYQIYADVNQLIYDGGITKLQKNITNMQNLIDTKQVEIDMHTLKSQVTEVFFSILLWQQQQLVLQNNLQLLEQKSKSIQAAVNGGIMKETDLLNLEAEILQLDQELERVTQKRSSSQNILQILTGRETPGILVVSDYALPVEGSEEYNRPEVQLYNLQTEANHTQMRLLQNQNNPKISAFLQGGMGSPNPLNFFDEDFSPYYQLGIRANWNIWDWNKSKRKIEQVQLQNDIIKSRKDHLQRNISIQLERLRHDINQLEKLVSQDQEIIAKRSRIRKLSSLQLDNGIITTTQFLEAVNEEKLAQLALENHIVRLKQTKIQYKLEQGSL